MAASYSGNKPRNVSKDAKYSVVHDGAVFAIRLIYVLNYSERALLTTTKHPDLIRIVNAVKEEIVGSPGGAFYINEFQHVIVPADGDYYYAGTYTAPLRFDFEGKVIGPKAPDGLTPGDEWPGPHVGIPYVLTAERTDIRYESEPRPNVIRRELLSATAGREGAAALAKRLARHKGGSGRIYVNEAREFFAPVESATQWSYLYLGNLGDDQWFPEPRTGSSQPQSIPTKRRLS
jgi:hypothetical protein